MTRSPPHWLDVANTDRYVNIISVQLTVFMFMSLSFIIRFFTLSVYSFFSRAPPLYIYYIIYLYNIYLYIRIYFMYIYIIYIYI